MSPSRSIPRRIPSRILGCALALLAASLAGCAGLDSGPSWRAPNDFGLPNATLEPFEHERATIRIRNYSRASLTLVGETFETTLECRETCDVGVETFPTGAKHQQFTVHEGTRSLPAVGPPYTIRRGETLEVAPRFHPGGGEVVVLFDDFHAAALAGHEPLNARVIYAYLPPSYREHTTRRYPVVYMHDGRNLFDDTSSITGVAWRVQEALEQAFDESGSVEELIVIGIDQIVRVEGTLQNRRQGEYNPTPTVLARPPAGDEYVRFVAEELKPAVDAALRTLPDREHTATMGSSLGATISLWAAHRYPDVFGRVIALSLATGVDNRWLNEQLRAGRSEASLVYLDMGTGEDPSALGPFLSTYRSLGLLDGESLRSHVELAGRHDEASWAARLPRVFAEAFPARRDR